MPKVEKSRSRPHAADNDVLEEAGPTAMAVSEQAADEPVKPSFAPLSAHEQNGKRLEFRRARTNPSLRFFAARHVLQLKGQLLMLAELLVCWRNCQAFPLLNMLAHPYKSGKALSEPAVAHLGAAVGWRTCAQRNSWIREAGQTIQHSFGRVPMQIPVPQHRMTPLKETWLKLYEPITQNMKLDMRMNLKSKKVRRRRLLAMAVCCLLTALSLVLASASCRRHKPKGHSVWRCLLDNKAVTRHATLCSGLRASQRIPTWCAGGD